MKGINKEENKFKDCNKKTPERLIMEYESLTGEKMYTKDDIAKSYEEGKYDGWQAALNTL